MNLRLDVKKYACSINKISVEKESRISPFDNGHEKSVKEASMFCIFFGKTWIMR